MAHSTITMEVFAPSTVVSATATETVNPRPYARDTAHCSLPQVSPHLWLERPLPPEANDWVSTYYPYGSTAGGTYLVHHGVDLTNPHGTPVLAVGSGMVLYAGDDSDRAFGPRLDFYGRMVILLMDRKSHGQSVFTLYGHLSDIAVGRGERVVTGQKLGEVGATGIAIGPHLHFEVRITDSGGYHATRNPELWLRPHAGRGVIAGRVLDESGRPLPGVRLDLYMATDSNNSRREGWTYVDDGPNPDEEWFENLVLGDVPVGAWVIVAHLPGRSLRQEVEVHAGEISWVCLRALSTPPRDSP